MDMLPKAVFVVLVTASMHQTATNSWTPAWERHLPPLFRLDRFHRPPGQSHFLNAWTDLDDTCIWPEFNGWGIHYHQLIKPRLNYVTSVPQPAQRCQGGFVKYGDTNKIQNKFDIEERQLQLRENHLRKDREHLSRMKREDHENRTRENKKRLQELEKEENRRLEEQRLKKDQRRTQNLRAREEQHQRLENQRRVEKERQERRIKSGIAQQRHAEERECRAQQQQREEEHKRQMQERLRNQKELEPEEYKKQRNSRKGRHTSPHSSQQFTAEFTEITSLNVPEGYDPEDISIETVGNQMFTKGSHVCSCDENCFEREFERRISLPDDIDTHSLTASLHQDGRLSVQGTRYRHAAPPVNTVVPVKGIGLPQKQRTSISCKFNANKTGFKLKKMNARTGEVLDDIEPIQEDSYPLYEKEVDDDGLTIEVVD